MKRMNATAMLLLGVLAAASCSESKKVLWVRVDCSNMTIRCVDEFELTFRPTGTTEFKGSSNGSWSGGDIQYATEEREGVTIFTVTVSGGWIRDEVTKNREKFPTQFIFELPVKNVEASGSFEVRGYWRYSDVVTGTARPPTGGILTLPDADSIYLVAVYRETNDLCQTNPPDSETSPEVVEDIEPSGDLYEDIELPEAPEIPDEAEAETVPDAPEEDTAEEPSDDAGEE
jgi:hypothetical protein